VLDFKGLLSGTLRLIEDLSDQAVVHIAPIGLDMGFRMKTKVSLQFVIGDKLSLKFNPDSACFFDGAGLRIA
jgi:hypothetical protein